MIYEYNIKRYCCEDIPKIENYEKAIADTTQIWHCHHRLETHNSDGERRLINLSMKELKALDMYFNRPANELIFMTNSEHKNLHYKEKKRKPFSEEHKRNLSKALKGRKFSEEWKRNMSKAQKGTPGHTKGRHWKLVDGKRVFY